MKRCRYILQIFNLKFSVVIISSDNFHNLEIMIKQSIMIQVIKKLALSRKFILYYELEFFNLTSKTFDA